MLRRDSSPPGPFPAHPDTAPRPGKRARIDDREPTQDRFDFVSQPPYESISPSDLAPDGGKKAHPKKQPLSCAECRRLKLKCDRNFPCQSCQKRGCAQICPQGALTSGKGSRFILANTEELHGKIAEMSERIQQLEEAVAYLQSSFSNDPHPLLRSDLLRIKSSAELHRAQMAGPKTASRSSVDEYHENDSAKDLPPAPFQYPAREPSFYPSIPAHEGLFYSGGKDGGIPEIPSDIFALSQNFPVPWTVNSSTRKRIRDLLPSRPEAEHVCGQCRRYALWQYNLDPSETFLPNLINHVYTSSIEELSARRLALLLMMLAIGTQVDVTQEVDSPRGDTYHNLARAALCEVPIMEQPDMDLMHNLFYMMWYLLIFSDKDNAAIYAWSIMGLAAKQAQALGLHRDGAGRKVIPEEAERRRFILWELLNLDARLALSLGRPPSFNITHIDCKRPNYNIEGLPYVSKPLLYLEWKHNFFKQCLNPVLEATVAAQPGPYSQILELDGILRMSHVPPELDMFGPDGLSTGRPFMMQQILVSTGREILILQLHRGYFTQGLSGSEPFTLSHPYAPSVVATYCSACRLLSILETAMKQEPLLCKRVFGFWFNMFSAVVAICFFVSRAPHSLVTPMAVRELQRVRLLFDQVAEDNPRASRAQALLDKLVHKATRIFDQYRESGGQSEDDMDIPVARRQLAISDTRSRLQSSTETDPFEHAHPTLKECLRKTRAMMDRHNAHMFISNSDTGLDEEDLRPNSFISHTPSTTSYVPSRVGNQNLNFDFGALTMGPDDQSLMTWF